MAEKKKLLFFDDEPYISYALAKSLELFNWDVTLVSDIGQLFEKFVSNNFDILLLDIMAPVPDSQTESVEFTKKEIKQMEKGTNTGIVVATKIWTMDNKKFLNMPILFLSARRQPDTIKTFKENGRKCDCLRKPELAKTINEKLLELIK